MTPDDLIFVYVLTLLGTLSALAVYYDFRRKHFAPGSSQDNVFRCEKCAYVYTDDPDVDRSRCPQCGTQNATYQF